MCLPVRKGISRDNMQFMLWFCRNAHAASANIYAYRLHTHAHVAISCKHTHTHSPSLTCLGSDLQLLPVPPPTHTLPCITLVPVEAVTYRRVNLHTLLVIPLHFSHNATEILWKVIWGPLPFTPPSSLLLSSSSSSPSSTPSSVQRSERWDGGINTLPPKPTLGMIDGQMQEGSGGGGERWRLKERSLRVHKSKVGDLVRITH